MSAKDIIYDAIKETPQGASTEIMVEGIVEMLSLSGFAIVSNRAWEFYKTNSDMLPHEEMNT